MPVLIPVEIVEKAEKVKAKLDKAFLLVLAQGTEDLCCVKHMLSVHDPIPEEQHKKQSISQLEP